MALTLEEALEELEQGGVPKFSRLFSICQHFFGEARIKGDHHIFRTGMPDIPIVNIQPDGRDAKKYQVRQVIRVLQLFREA